VHDIIIYSIYTTDLNDLLSTGSAVVNEKYSFTETTVYIEC